MNCKLDLTNDSDTPYWVNWSAFMRHVDVDDLACRESQEVTDCYLSSWFRLGQNGQRLFNPPAFYLKNGRALFINGRHRAILLSRHLDVLPMALTQMDATSQPALHQIAERRIDPDEVFVLPDLPEKDVYLEENAKLDIEYHLEELKKNIQSQRPSLYERD
jgi:hypothetical protein